MSTTPLNDPTSPYCMDFVGPITKNQKTKRTKAHDKARRVGLEMKTFELKIQWRKLSQATREALRMVFVEAKWVKNYQIGSGYPFVINTKGNKVTDAVLVKTYNAVTKKCDIIESRPLRYLGSQMIQAVIEKVKQDIINLSKAKAAGRKVGKLRFASEVNSIPLKQYNTTYKVTPKGVYLQKIGFVKVRGLDQLFTKEGTPKGEFASGQLIQSATGYYVKVLTYCQKLEQVLEGESGLDYGVKTPIVLDKGADPELSVSYPKSLKVKHRKLSRAKRGSKNRKVCKRIVAKGHIHWNNAKQDKVNQFIHIMKQKAFIGMQDDCIAGWKRLWGKRLQEVNIGEIKRRIQALPTCEIISRFVPTTKECPRCLKLVDIPLSERTFTCSCGFTEARDRKSAKCILAYAKYQREHPGKELIRLAAEDRATVYSSYEFSSLTGDAANASDFSPR